MRLTMNLRKFNSLPPEVQKILVEVGRGYEEQAGKSLNARQAAGLAGLAKVGAKMKVLPEAARAGWAKSLAGFPSRQAKDADGRGMPGTEVMKNYIDAVNGTGYKWPHSYSVE